MRRKKELPYLLCSFLIVIVVFIVIKLTLSSSQKYELVALDEGWQVSINNSEYVVTSMTKLYKVMRTPIEAGDHIIFKHTLPDTNVPNPVLFFRSKYTSLNCYIDGKNIYSFGDNYIKAKKFLGKMYHVISLPSDYAGKSIVFDMYSGENNAFDNFAPPILGYQPDVTGKFVHDNLIIIATGMFMFVFGLTFLCIAMVFVNFVPEVKSLLVGSLFCMNLSIWLLTYYNILSLFIYTESETEIEYFTMYLIVPYCFWLLYYIKELRSDRIYKSLMAICCGVPIVQYILHYVFNIHLRATLPLYHLTGVLGFTILLYYAIVTNRHKNQQTAYTMIQLSGLLFFALGQFIHLIIYILDILHVTTNQMINKYIISAGCLIFAVCQLSTYLVFITISYAKKQENISLSHLAYADGLTDLANRSKSDKLMAELNSATDDYCILSIDLNGLKEVNDKFGHPSGDRYIKEFAKVLSNTFGETDFCARIGGDEFLVILRDANTKDINAMIGRMNSALNVMNALYPEYKRSVSTGFAFKHECEDNSSHQVYLLADQRMYENKRKMHQALGIKPRL
ncbi:GGDEF domain-containing protein [Butyrivibrio sp. VCB2006]|uniref:GGDEF domain-containing protein n=1 Tax=Butyrivibrio sp. VCB2006 TaxID=1280679 RepID=UPI00040C9AF7|nr:GGDEF domain-containing protein [Butyrivibrio sp. VCB2006]